MTSRPVYGLLLAGGKSRRMGRDKALLQNKGQSQLAYLAGVLESCVDKVFVSARKDQAGDKTRAEFAQIVDRYDDLGPVAGILSAFDEYPEADWLVVACDLPNVDEDTLRFLLDNRDGEQYFTAYSSTYDELPEPLCAIYHAGSDAVVREFVEAGVNCPRKILIRSDTRLLEQPHSHALDNVNTPDDLRESVLESES